MCKLRCLPPQLIALLVSILCFTFSNVAWAAPITSKDKVKVTVKTETPADGKQVITLTLEIAKGWHAYANPVGNKEMLEVQTTVTFTAGEKALPAKVEYPAGKVVKDVLVGDYNIYEGTVTITASLDRMAVPGPVKVAICLQTVNDKLGLLPSIVTKTID